MDFFKAFIKQPFSADMDAYHWALFIALLMIIVIFWNIILHHIFGDIR